MRPAANNRPIVVLWEYRFVTAANDAFMLVEFARQIYIPRAVNLWKVVNVMWRSLRI
jgi:hypothetical protein